MGRLVPSGATERFVQVAEGQVRVLEGGAGDGGRTPVFLIHGGGTDNAGISWFRAFAELGVDRRVVAVDLPGFGASRDIPPLGGPERMADFVVRVAQRLGVDHAAVVGVSMGGDIALNVALRSADFVKALVLISPGGLAERVGGPVTHFFAWLGAKLPDAILLPLTRVANRFTRAALKAMVSDVTTLPSEVVDEFVREASAPGAGIGYGRYNQATLARTHLRNNLLPRVHEITAPTLFFHGASDPMVRPEDSQAATQRMPRAMLVLVPGVGHWGQLEAHERFTSEVRAFLSDVDDQRSR